MSGSETFPDPTTDDIVRVGLRFQSEYHPPCLRRGAAQVINGDPDPILQDGTYILNPKGQPDGEVEEVTVYSAQQSL